MPKISRIMQGTMLLTALFVVQANATNTLYGFTVDAKSSAYNILNQSVDNFAAGLFSQASLAGFSDADATVLADKAGNLIGISSSTSLTKAAPGFVVIGANTPVPTWKYLTFTGADGTAITNVLRILPVSQGLLVTDGTGRVWLFNTPDYSRNDTNINGTATVNVTDGQPIILEDGHGGTLIGNDLSVVPNSNKMVSFNSQKGELLVYDAATVNAYSANAPQVLKISNISGKTQFYADAAGNYYISSPNQLPSFYVYNSSFTNQAKPVTLSDGQGGVINPVQLSFDNQHLFVVDKTIDPVKDGLVYEYNLPLNPSAKNEPIAVSKYKVVNRLFTVG